jgi:hypothetical protein
MGLLAAQLPLIFFLILTVHQNIEPYVSSRSAVEYLMQRPDVQGKVMCSKFFARGTRYFSGKGIVLMNINGQNFFSPHPILDLNTDQKLVGFLKTQRVTHGVLNDHAWEALQRVCPLNGFKAELLKQIGDEYVVKVTFQ